MQKILRCKGYVCSEQKHSQIEGIFAKLERFDIGGDPIVRIQITEHENTQDGLNFSVHAHLTADGHHELYAESRAEDVIKACHATQRSLHRQLAKHVNKRADYRKGHNHE
jgi:ribosome-associated translation inhibitor RaiA